MEHRHVHLGCALACTLALLVSCKGKTPLAPTVPTGDGPLVCADGSSTLDPMQEVAPDVKCPATEEPVLCYGQWAAHCHGGKLGKLENCRQSAEVCSPGKCAGGKCGGCLACLPNSTRCGGNAERMACKADGSGYALAETCDESAGKRCSIDDGKCEDLCSAAVSQHSYVGCEYWALPTANSELLYDLTDADGLCQPFPFAVAISNTEGVTAHVHIDSNGSGRDVQVAPAEVKTVELPCNLELKGDPTMDLPSVQVQGAAHHIVSDVPVTVYQFNPLEYQSKDATGRKVYSYTNDASLLLPVSSLTGNYRVLSRATLLQSLQPSPLGGKGGLSNLSGFVAIIGVQATPTDVEIISSAYTRASTDGKIPKLSPGSTLHVTLKQGEVLQLASDAPGACSGGPVETSLRGKLTYCDVPKEYDLTGTQIRAAASVSVISGNDCTFVPYDKWACDHLEETMFPVESWGKDLYMTVSAPVNCGDDIPNMFRILSSADNNQLTFTPASVHAAITLKRGEYVEFTSLTAFEVTGTKAISVGQYLLGQDWNGKQGASGAFAKGDPSLSLGIPIEQWRSRYSFLTPATYTDNFINIVASAGQVVILDGGLVSGFTPIEGTSMTVARVPVQPGTHVISSGAIFELILYGYATYTSYMLPGGLDLHAINTPE